MVSLFSPFIQKLLPSSFLQMIFFFLIYSLSFVSFHGPVTIAPSLLEKKPPCVPWPLTAYHSVFHTEASWKPSSLVIFILTSRSFTKWLNWYCHWHYHHCSLIQWLQMDGILYRFPRLLETGYSRGFLDSMLCQFPSPFPESFAFLSFTISLSIDYFINISNLLGSLSQSCPEELNHPVTKIIQNACIWWSCHSPVSNPESSIYWKKS